MVSYILILIGIGFFLTPYVMPLATVHFYSTFDPYIKSYNFQGTSEDPKYLSIEEAFTPTAYVVVDEDTVVLIQQDYTNTTVNGELYATYVDTTSNASIFKVHAVGFTPEMGVKYHITMHITCRRQSTGELYRLTAEGYVIGGEIVGTWYLIANGKQYDLSSLGKYEVLTIPMPPDHKIQFKYIVSSGEQYVDSATIKIWEHKSGIEAWKYYSPDWTVTLNKISDNTWTGEWTIPEEGVYDILGYITVQGKEYRQLTISIPFGEETGIYQILMQIIGVVFIASGLVLYLPCRIFRKCLLGI